MHRKTQHPPLVGDWLEYYLFWFWVVGSTICFCVRSQSIGCPQRCVFWTACLWGRKLADREERSDERDHLCFGLASLIQPLRGLDSLQGLRTNVHAGLCKERGHRWTHVTLACAAEVRSLQRTSTLDKSLELEGLECPLSSTHFLLHILAKSNKEGLTNTSH